MYEASQSSGKPVELYTFGLGALTWRVNDSVASIDIGGTIFQPQSGISHSEINAGEEPIDVFLPADHTLPRMFVGISPGQRVSVTIQHMQFGFPETLRVVYKGMLKSVALTENGTRAELHVESIVTTFDIELPQNIFSVGCNRFLFDSECGASQSDPANFHTAVVTAVDGNTITVAGLSAKGEGWAVPGFVKYGLADYRQIFKQSGSVVTLSMPFSATMVGQTVTVYAGCPHSIEACASKFGQLLNHLGFHAIPTTDIFSTGL